jgi:simple sugar transport system ATP-binding protein
MVANQMRDEVTLDELTQQMAGGTELDDLRHELERR